MTPRPRKNYKPRKKKSEYTDFPGFRRYYDFRKDGDTFMMYPTILTAYWCDLTGSEQKVLDFILRQTFGWYKSSDSIGLAQFTGGIPGKHVNRGTGLSRSTVQAALKGLVKKGFITVKHRANWVSQISLVLRKDGVDEYLEGVADVLDAFKKDKK